jgi:hypothetical protein
MEVDTSGSVWWRLASVFDNGNGRRWALAIDGGNGWQLWQRWTIEMAFKFPVSSFGTGRP